jgi:hypothetical protein
MAEITREPYVFSVDGEYLHVFKDGAEVDCVALSRASCEEDRHYIILPTLLMNANFSAAEWNVLNGSAVETFAEEVAETASETVAEEAPVAEVAAPAATSRRGRRRF